MKSNFCKRIEWLAFFLVLKLLGGLPRVLSRYLGLKIMTLFFSLKSESGKKIAHTNLMIAFPEISEKERNKIILGMYKQIGWLLAEMSYFPYHTQETIDKILVVEGIVHYEEAAAYGKGVLMLSAHTSAWELFSFGFYNKGFYWLARPMRNLYFNKLVNDYRCYSGNYLINVRDSLGKVSKILSNGGTVGISIDQNTALNGLFVDFFGKNASTATGLAALALKTGAKVVPAFTIWDEALKKYRIQIHPSVEVVNTGDKKADILENTKRFTEIIEKQIRAFPDQWLWTHRRWKTRPSGELSLYDF